MYNRCTTVLGLILIIGVLFTLAGCRNSESKPLSSDHESTVVHDGAENNDAEKLDVKEEHAPDWSAITENGLDEEKFLEKMNVKDLEAIASELQTLMDEVVEEEKENPAIVITEGYPRVFQKAQYQKVIDMGEKAEMPLYYILYKSNHNGMYEHICAAALSSLTGLVFMDDSGAYMQWSSGKEYLELFNAYMIRKLKE